jgi:hypothetical protein
MNEEGIVLCERRGKEAKEKRKKGKSERQESNLRFG